MTDDPWNPRYVAYALAHGRSPEQMLHYDRAQWPGGCMAGFLIWIQERWSAWHALHKLPSDHVLSEADHNSFDAFLGRP